jgi:hypothetical protein
MTKLVAIGVILEGPELVYAIFNAVKRWRKRPTREHDPEWIIVVGIVGWVLVSIGVAGEFWVDGKVNTDDDNIQSINITLLRDAGASASQARSNANSAHDLAQSAADVSAHANGLANAASLASSKAVGVAGGAIREADSLKQDIVSAKNEAADAVSRLAGAEQKLADATQREVNAEEALKRLKTPRSLSNIENLATSLRPFKGTEYTMSVAQDDEAFQLTRDIDKILKSAGWTRKQPEVHAIGITYFNIFSQDFKDGVSVCVATGVTVSVRSKESIESLQSRPPLYLPKMVQVALILRNDLAASILPSDEHNVDKGVVDPIPAEEGPMQICVGKKP